MAIGMNNIASIIKYYLMLTIHNRKLQYRTVVYLHFRNIIKHIKTHQHIVKFIKNDNYVCFYNRFAYR